MSTQYDKDLIWKLLNGAQHEACLLKANSDNPIWKHLTGAQNEVAQLKRMIGERNERISCLMMMHDGSDEEIKILKEENEKLQHCKDLYIPDFEREQEENEKLWLENKKLKEEISKKTTDIKKKLKEVISKEYDRGYKNAEIHLNHWILLGKKWEEWANCTGYHPCKDCGDIIGQQEFPLLGDYNDICYNCEMLTTDEMEKPQ